jgi:hypothetical protein
MTKANVLHLYLWNASQHHDLKLPIASRNTIKKLRALILYDGPTFKTNFETLFYTHCWELMKSLSSHDSLSSLFSF